MVSLINGDQWCRGFVQMWSDMKHRYRYSRERNWESHWCKRNFLNKKVLNDVADLVKELTRRLATFNITPTRGLGGK